MRPLSDKTKKIVLAILACCFLLSIGWRASRSPVLPAIREPISLRAVGRDFQWCFHHEIPTGSGEVTRVVELGSRISVPPYTDVRLELSSEDYVYFLQVEQLDLKEVVVPGVSQTVFFQTPPTGELVLESGPMCGFLAFHDPVMARLDVE